jgi:phage terminase large subunit
MSRSKWDKFRPPQKLASYDPHPFQRTFHQDEHKYRAVVSGVGGGKSRMGCEEIIKWTQLYPGSLGIIGRLTAKSLRETTQRRFFEVCPPSLIANYNKGEEHLWIKTNEVDEDGRPIYSEILFMHLDEPGPLGSLDISYFWIDECHEPDGQEVPEATFQMLTARLRHPVGPHRGFITSNSGGKDWVWNRFFNEKNKAIEYIGWTTSSMANAKYLPPGYVEELMRNNPQTWVDRFINASFDAFEGQIFTDFDEDTHGYRDRDGFEISPYWEHGAGFDFGVTAPTSLECCAIDRDGDLWVYDEIYKPNADITEFAKAMKNKGFDTTYADPSVVNKGPNKKSPKQLYAEENVVLLPVSNDTDYFLALFLQYLRKRKPDGSVCFHINLDRCPHLVNQIKQAAWDPSTISGSTHDKIKNAENHALDAFKYYLNGAGLQPGQMNPVKPGATKEAHSVKGQWEHDSYWDDLDFDEDNYIHQTLKEVQ